MSAIGDRIKVLREERGMKQVELASAIEVLPSRVSQWETDQRDVPSELIAPIAKALAVTADELLYLEVA